MAGNYVLLETIALTQSAASVTFDNLPTSGYTDLKIVSSGRTSSASVQGYITAAFNGSTANFSIRGLYGTGSSTGSFTTPSNFVGEVVGDTATASTFSNLEMYIPNYTSSSNKSYSVDGVAENNATFAQSGITAGLWSQTAAITSIAFTPNTGSFLAGSTFSLYGVAALGTTPVLAPKATGGNIVANDGTYWYHAFTSSGNFVPQVGLTADVLVVAGGGGSNQYNGGGGGAGGLLLHSAQSVANGTNYSCTIGAGGAQEASGANSQFGALTASVGGGRGGARGFYGGASGGSGGGGGAEGAPNGTAGSASPSGQGNNGGNGADGGDFRAGGGGGAGAAGTAGGASSGNGGAGLNTWSAWLSATSLGVSGYVAGGGGGGANYTSAGTGGAGGGGNGALIGGAGTSAITNTGSGGGGGKTAGGTGGSGVIIIRYPIA